MYTVKHKVFGEGTVKSRTNGYIEIDFCGKIRKFVFPDAFDSFLSTDSEVLKLEIEKAKIAKEPQLQASRMMQETLATNSATVSNVKASAIPTRVPFRSTGCSLIGPRSQTIEVRSEEEMFELVGYMSVPNRVSSIEAEVPKDGRDKEFERMFPGQKYRPIEMRETPSGMPNKLSPQFRINFSNLRNCPPILKANMGVGNGSCVGRINKSRFVIDLVENYGFRFGEFQDYNRIRKNAEERGYLNAFERGYSL